MNGPQAATPFLVADGLYLTLAGRSIVHDLNLSLQPGELVGVIGPNGAGKSTLLRGLAGLLPPSRGQVTLAGVTLAGMPPRERARQLAYLPQDRTVHWPLTVERVVALGRSAHRAPPAASAGDDAAAVAAAMADADVAHLSGRSVTMLSGGELARVLLARALAQAPRVLLADEPAAGLDPAHQLGLFDQLTRLSRSGVAVLVALHDLSLALRYCSRILLLRDGRALALGPPLEVVTSKSLAAAYGIDARVSVIAGVPVVVPLARVVDISATRDN
jgi:iron complex transport system ATP-binding protein